VYIEDFPLAIVRNGCPERAYFTFCYSPIRGHDGKVLGMLDTVTETTASVVTNQRLNFLDNLGRAVTEANDRTRSWPSPPACWSSTLACPAVPMR
jgi:hypothetical protein